MKTVLITGANRGLGLELAQVFSDDSFSCILHSRRGANLTGEQVCGDLRSQKTIDALASAAQAKGLDILINNAGVHLAKPFIDMTIEEIREVIEVNLIAPILLTKAVWPIFLRQNSGLVININSLAGRAGGPGESIYSASKAGLAGFGETVQFDATRAGIRVLNLNIGGMRTDMGHGRTGSSKFIDPRDAARAILGFCEDYPTMRITSADLKRRVY
jgi:NAD(P)-dependent dehydrogenase (short-subunit alcohol dehydrogenase family)